jgi:hypothetical protein
MYRLLLASMNIPDESMLLSQKNPAFALHSRTACDYRPSLVPRRWASEKQPNCREQAFTQLCAFPSPFCVLMSEMGRHANYERMVC